MVHVSDAFLNSTHGKLSCISCHEGDKTTMDKDKSHAGLVTDPSEVADVFCAGCHGNIVSTFENSLHKTQNGYYTLFEARAGFDLRTNPHLKQEFDAECGKCHTSCGQCHISRPNSVKGGFISGHSFRKTPSMTNNCTACHGSRVGAEYMGENTGISADVHWLPNAKRCEFCHTGNEMHGGTILPETRYSDHVNSAARCESCHESVRTSNAYHIQHWANGEDTDTSSHLSCQVCHAQNYKNCNACHTGGAGITGSSYISFKIGKNPLKTENHPYDYSVVRHVPLQQDTYASWGNGAETLTNFDEVPTWKYATPHNIKRWTARTDTTGLNNCWENCHNNWVPALDTYLRAEDLLDYEINANQQVLMPVK